MVSLYKMAFCYLLYIVSLCILVKADIKLSRISDIRLVGGSNPYEGRLEVLYRGSWMTVCESYDRRPMSWDESEARVVCRQLGFNGGCTVGGAFYGEGTLDFCPENIVCLGTEQSIANCSSIPVAYDIRICSHTQDAGVKCEDPELTGDDIDEIRLVNGSSPYEGRVEVFYAGEWGTVCQQGRTVLHAQVVCRELGYTGGCPVFDAQYGAGSGRIWLDNVLCTGLEKSLSECKHEPPGCHSCVHSQDAGVRCDMQGPGSEELSQIRVQEGGAEGRLQIFYDTKWRTVCYGFWRIPEAQVVCRQLGYEGGCPADKYRYGAGETSIMVDNLRCSSLEDSLSSCCHDDVQTEKCTDAQTIRCNDPRLLVAGIRLVGGSTDYEGKVEVSHGGGWRGLCREVLRDSLSLEVICRQLGYTGGTLKEFFNYQNGDGTLWRMSVQCTFWEASLSQCCLGTASTCTDPDILGVMCESSQTSSSDQAVTEISHYWSILIWTLIFVHVV